MITGLIANNKMLQYV